MAQFWQNTVHLAASKNYPNSTKELLRELFAFVMSIKTVLAVVWAFLASLTWLIPNHYRPWTNFHSDAWMTIVAALTFFPLVCSKEKTIIWPLFASVAFLLGFVPWLHYFSGLLGFIGQAWIASSYLLAFSLAIVVSANLEKRMPGVVLSAFFGAIVLASIASVGLTLGSWAEVLETGLTDYLSMGYSGDRHYANLGQPNMLASLLLWGVIGCLWAYSKKIISIRVAIFASAYLVLGIVLTKSRTVYIAGALVIVVLVAYGQFKNFKVVQLFCLSLLLMFFGGVHFFQWMDINVMARAQDAVYVRYASYGDVRFAAWTLFIDAIGDRPWFGYGWSEVVSAQIAVADRYPSLGGMFGHTHNLILDLCVWLGVPLASMVIVFLSGWLIAAIKRINKLDDLLLLLLLVVVGVHSMFEYPLQYASFLIPVGIVVGVVSERAALGLTAKVGRVFFGGICLVSTFLLFGLIGDYLKVEESYKKWRFDRAGLVYPIANVPSIPNLAFLNQFAHWFEMIRRRPHTQMTSSELDLRERTVKAYPSAGAMYEMALAYALNDRPEDAKYWLARVCKLTNSSECATLRGVWSIQQKNNAYLQNIDWPEE